MGDWVYSLGIFGVTSLSLIFVDASDGTKENRFFLLTLAIILISAIPIAFPLVPMILATMIYNKRRFKS